MGAVPCSIRPFLTANNVCIAVFILSLLYADKEYEFERYA